MAKKKSSRKPAKTPQFEEALSQLENVVDCLESEKLPLEEMVTQYELGMKLLRSCQSRLSDAEKRIEHLSQGVETLEADPVEGDDEDIQQEFGASSLGGEERASKDEDNDEIRLF